MQRDLKGVRIKTIIRFVLAISYSIFILRMTLMNRTIHPDYLFCGLFWELKNHMWGDIFKNIALFVPFGFIVGERKGVLLGFLFSCGIELTQYVTRLGYCEIDDVLNNTIGTVIGCLTGTNINQAIEYIGENNILERSDMMRKIKRIAVYDIPKYITVASILNTCGKDMAKKYDLHHWDNSFIKSLAIVCLCAIKNEIYLLYNDEKPVATFQISIKENILHFEKLGTIPTESGKGIGSLCMRCIERIAKKRSCNKVVMEVYEPSQHALLFYEHKGYKRVGMVDTLKYKQIKMEKEI